MTSAFGRILAYIYRAIWCGAILATLAAVLRYLWR